MRATYLQACAKKNERNEQKKMENNAVFFSVTSFLRHTITAFNTMSYKLGCVGVENVAISL